MKGGIKSGIGVPDKAFEIVGVGRGKAKEIALPESCRP